MSTKKPDYEEIAAITDDIDIFSGFANMPFYNPDKVLQTQGSQKGIKLYDEVLADSQAGSVMQTRIDSVAGKEWDIIPAKKGVKMGRPSATPQEQKIADFVKQTLLDCNFMQAKQELLKAILYGYYVAEVMWQNKDNAVTIKKIIGKHPSRFRFDWERQLHLLTFQNIIYGELVPERKFITLTFGDSDNPYGIGLGQKLWWPVWFKKTGIKFWLIFLEKFGMPTTMIKHPRGLKEDEKKKLLEIVKAVQTQTGVRIPDDVSLSLLEATRSGNVSYESLCNYMDAQISKVVLGQTLTTDAGKTGSYAQSKTHNEVRQDLIQSDAKMLDDLLNDTLIKWLVDYNFFDVKYYPKLKTHVGQKPDLVTQAAVDEILVGKIGVKLSQQYFYDAYGRPKPLEGEEIAVPAKKPAPEFSEFREPQIGQQVIDNYAEQAAIKADNIMQNMIASIIKQIKSAKSMADVGKMIYEIYPKLDTNNFQELLARAMLAANIKGYGAAKSES